MMKFKDDRRGVTIIEMLVWAVIIAIISTVSFLMLINYRPQRDLKLTAEEIVAVLRDTQNRSITQENGKQWGVRFNNGAVDQYEVFKGPNYASSTSVGSYSLRRPNIVFIDPPEDSAKEIVFNPVTGLVNSYFSITLGVINVPNEQRVIEITPIGKINVF